MHRGAASNDREEPAQETNHRQISDRHGEAAKRLRKSMPTRILIVDDHSLVREGLAGLLSAQSDFEVCGQATTAAEARRLVGVLGVNVAIIDLALPDGNGIDLIKEFKKNYPWLKMLVLSMHDETLFAERALRAGAVGYVGKNEASRVIIQAIRHVLRGQVYLSPRMTERMVQRAVGSQAGFERSPVERLSDREMEVFQMLGRGMTSRQIARCLQLSPKTVDTHREHIKSKLELKNAAELTQHAVQWLLENRHALNH